MEAQEYWSGKPIPSPVDLPNPGIELESPALQVDSLPTELSGTMRRLPLFLNWITSRSLAPMQAQFVGHSGILDHSSPVWGKGKHILPLIMNLDK